MAARVAETSPAEKTEGMALCFGVCRLVRSPSGSNERDSEICGHEKKLRNV